MIEMKAQLALDLVPIMNRLYDGGILRVGPGKEVQMTEKAFHEVFPDVLVPMPRESEEYPFAWAGLVEGVKFFALAKKGEQE